jgi:hypothetical protein
VSRDTCIHTLRSIAADVSALGSYSCSDCYGVAVIHGHVMTVSASIDVWDKNMKPSCCLIEMSSSAVDRLITFLVTNEMR